MKKSILIAMGGLLFCNHADAKNVYPFMNQTPEQAAYTSSIRASQKANEAKAVALVALTVAVVATIVVIKVSENNPGQIHIVSF